MSKTRPLSHRRHLVAFVAGVVAAGFCASASARVTDFEIEDHGDGNLGPDYGLRIGDDTFSYAPGVNFSFDP
jgi:hypothetical protein